MTAYDAAHAAAVVAWRDERVFLRVHGRDPVKMLQGLITNDLAGAPESRAVFAAVLTPKGRMIADVRVVKRGAELLLETSRDAHAGLTAHLKKFVPPLFARFEDTTLRMCGVYGANARAIVAQLLDVDGAALQQEDDVVAQGDVLCIATSHFGMPGFDVIAPPERAEELFAALVTAGAVAADDATLDVLRVEAGTPRWGAELDENTIPLEAGLRTRAISETKGCYTGQEVIIRILHRGHVNWQLRGVLLGNAVVPARGDALVNEAGKQVGRITSAVQSPRHAQAIALAYVRREVEPGSVLKLDDADARVVALPFEGGA